jgi:glycogen debranching enzyme
VTLVEGSTFAISLPSGDMLDGFPHGLFFRDTRFLSDLRLRVNGQWPEPLSARALYPFGAAFVLRAPPPPELADSSLVIFRSRYIGHGLRDDIAVRNYGAEPSFCALEIELDTDFADLFEVKAGAVRARRERTFSAAGGRLAWRYEHRGFRRETLVEFSRPVHLRDEVACFDVIVPPGGEWSVCMEVAPVVDDAPVRPRYRCGHPVEASEPVTRLEAWTRSLPTITCDHEGLGALVQQSAQDLAALRIVDPSEPGRTVVAAGAPWFMTLFGRDSLITSWMALLVDPTLAFGTLETLARHQGTDVDPVTEEEPGRILHEMRFGEAAELGLGGGRVYYGSVDATPLFVSLLGALHRWGHTGPALDALLPAADRALEWIDQYGDRDGDGYVEYQRATDRGLLHQGWKDSHDAIRFADGVLGTPPIALCEVQAYVYSALLARADLADATDPARANALRARAAELKERFNRDFWIPDRGWYAQGLDRDKRPLDALASNMGHCLVSGIVDVEKAPIVAARLLDRTMFTGWGVRTLASSMAGYNPVSYHTGSVWPHDTAICAAGLERYGFDADAHRVIHGLVDAGVAFGGRLPELFAGLERAELPFPVRYPTSCSPQAWAAASPLLLLRAMLGLDPDVPRGRVRLSPELPAWAGRLRVSGVPLGGGRLSLEAEGDRVDVLDAPPGLEFVVERPTGRAASAHRE